MLRWRLMRQSYLANVGGESLIREEYVAPKMFNQFTQPSVQRKPEVVKPTGMGSLLQQMANEKISHPDDEFLAQRIR